MNKGNRIKPTPPRLRQHTHDGSFVLMKPQLTCGRLRASESSGASDVDPCVCAYALPDLLRVIN